MRASSGFRIRQLINQYFIMHSREDYYLAQELLVEQRNRFYSVLRDLDESIFSVSSRFLRHEKYSGIYSSSIE